MENIVTSVNDEDLDKKIRLFQAKQIRDQVMILNLTMDIFETKYQKFMDKNAKDDFGLIKKSLSIISNSVKSI